MAARMGAADAEAVSAPAAGLRCSGGGLPSQLPSHTRGAPRPAHREGEPPTSSTTWAWHLLTMFGRGPEARLWVGGAGRYVGMSTCVRHFGSCNPHPALGGGCRPTLQMGWVSPRNAMMPPRAIKGRAGAPATTPQFPVRHPKVTCLSSPFLWRKLLCCLDLSLVVIQTHGGIHTGGAPVLV